MPIFVYLELKIDLTDKRCVSEEKGKNYAKDNVFIFTEVSAKDGINIQKLFNNELIPKITEKFKISIDDDDNVTKDNQNKGNVKLEDHLNPKRQKEDVVKEKKIMKMKIVSLFYYGS